MVERPPTLEVQVDPAAPWLGVQAVADEVERVATEVSAALALPGRPTTALQPLKSIQSGQPLRVYLNGKPLRYPSELLKRVQSLLAPPEAPEKWLAGITPDLAAQFLKFFIRELLRRQAGSLLTIEQSAAMAEGLPGNVPADWLHTVLTRLLALGIPIPTREVLTESLWTPPGQDGGALPTPVDFAEKLIQQPSLEIRHAPEWLRRLTSLPTEQGKLAHMRENLFEDLGVECPPIRFVADEGLPVNCVAFQVNALPALPLWAGDTTWDPTPDLRELSPALIHLPLLEDYLNQLKGLHDRLIESAFLKVKRSTFVAALRGLVAEKLSIRNLPGLLESMLDYDYIVADGQFLIIFDDRVPLSQPPPAGILDDPAYLTAFLRSRLKSYISYYYTQGRSTLPVTLIDASIENRLLRHLNGQPLTEDEQDQICAAVRTEYTSGANIDTPILTALEVRGALHDLLAPEFPALPVLAYQELSPSLNITPGTRITLS